MPTLRRTRVAGLDPAVVADWRASLADAYPGAPVRVLAWTPADDGFCLGSLAAFSLYSPAGSGGGGWRHVPWHTVERGGWNAENGQLQWRGYDSSRGSVRLTPARRLPDLFRERVAASIAVEQSVPFPGSRGFIVSGRRDLADDRAPLSWHVTLGRGLTWVTPGVEDAADVELARLRNEYDIG